MKAPIVSLSALRAIHPAKSLVKALVSTGTVAVAVAAATRVDALDIYWSAPSSVASGSDFYIEAQAYGGSGAHLNFWTGRSCLREGRGVASGRYARTSPDTGGLRRRLGSRTDRAA